MRDSVQNKQYARATAQERRRLAPLALVGLLLAASLGGCAQLRALKERIRGHDAPAPAAATAPAPRVTRAPAQEPPPSLAAIIEDQLQLGHYEQGERQLRRYLAANPDDRAAQSVLRQLTADPEQVLGRASRAYVVRPGDSYSTLAARFLGDSGRFLILARYNDATNPSVLRVGEKLRLPAARLASSAVAERPVADRPGGSPDAPSAKARRLQDESLALLRKGQRTQALERMDEALDVDPQLPPAGADAQALRKQLVAVYHQRAIVLYRDQQLDQAISLWNRVLAIEPDFEPASVYRARALELKQRLKQF